MFGIIKVFAMGVVAGWAYQEEINAVAQEGIKLGVKGFQKAKKVVEEYLDQEKNVDVESQDSDEAA